MIGKNCKKRSNAEVFDLGMGSRAYSSTARTSLHFGALCDTYLDSVTFLWDSRPAYFSPAQRRLSPVRRVVLAGSPLIISCEGRAQPGAARSEPFMEEV